MLVSVWLCRNFPTKFITQLYIPAQFRPCDCLYPVTTNVTAFLELQDVHGSHNPYTKFYFQSYSL
jgi:hypothetical protein